MQTGYYDKYVLCAKCDNEIIGRLERYSAALLYGGNTTLVPKFKHAVSFDGVKSIMIENIDYARFKLFILSILWRAHISQHKFFHKIDIADKQELIREMLLKTDPQKVSDFKICIVGVRNYDGFIRMIIEPGILEIEGSKVAMFFINGLFYFIELSPRSNFVLFNKHYLDDSGIYDLLLLENEGARSLLSAIGLPSYVVNNYFA